MNAPPRPGETIYKGHRSYNLMRSLQQGISFSVASVDKQVTNREAGVKPSDFKKEVRENPSALPYQGNCIMSRSPSSLTHRNATRGC